MRPREYSASRASGGHLSYRPSFVGTFGGQTIEIRRPMFLTIKAPKVEEF